jgi:hypothetical protein
MKMTALRFSQSISNALLFSSFVSRQWNNNRHHVLLGLIVSALFFAQAPTCRANVLSFNVSLDTSGLIGHSAGPFYIDFQLNDGSGDFAVGVNIATIGSFMFGLNGRPSGTPNLFGGAKGDLSNTVTLMDDAHFNNEFFQQFIPGTVLSFGVSLTTNVDPGLTPDAFSFSILDSTLSPIPTTNFADAFLFVNINRANLTTADLGNSIFAGDPNRPPAAGGEVILIGRPQIPGVPESGSSISILLVGIGAIWFLRGRFLHRV